MAGRRKNAKRSADAIAFGNRRKGKPRGKPFENGNHVGREWVPGESGNPSGSSKRQAARKAYYIARGDDLWSEFVDTFLLRAIGFNEHTPPEDRQRVIQLMLAGKIKQAPDFAKLHIEAMIGRPPQAIEHSGGVKVTTEDPWIIVTPAPKDDA